MVDDPTVRAALQLGIVSVLACAACDLFKGKETKKGPAPAVQTGAPAAREEELIRKQRREMGAPFQITISIEKKDATPENRAKAEAAIELAFQEIERLEAILSEWQATSEISRINAKAGIEPVAVGDDTLVVIRAGLEVSRWSDGAFDLSWAALRGLYDFNAEHPTPPDPREIAKRVKLVRYQDIVVDERERTVFLRRKGMAIGTGGIAKGYALDRASNILLAAGYESFMIFGGGQVQMHGGRTWRIGIRHPRKEDTFGWVEQRTGSVATAGDYEHAFVDPSGQLWHHIIDSKTGLPARNTVSVTVVAESGLYADALDTAMFVLGAESTMARLGSAPGNPTVYLVDSNMRLVGSPGALDKLHITTPLRDGRLP